MTEPSAETSNETLLSYLNESTGHDALPATPQPHHLHPFTPVPSDAPVLLLKNLVDKVSILNNALQMYSSLPITDHKLVSNLRQTSALIHSLNVSEQETRMRTDVLRDRERARTSYGEPIPLDRSLISDWCISRIEQWGQLTGMEIFKDEEKKGKVTIMLGGKVIVLEIDLTVQKNTPTLSDSHVSVASVKTSLALPPGISTGNALAERSASLDEYISRTWNAYLQEVQGDDVENSMRAAHYAKNILSQLSYLMRLDSLAMLEGDKGIRWFNDIGLMSSVAERVAQIESESVANSLQRPLADLDIFLTRAHALATPYLVAPTMSFVVFVSPLAYLSLARSTRLHSTPSSQPSPWKIDIPTSLLQSYLSRPKTGESGVTTASLVLEPSALPLNAFSEQIAHLGGRPKFRLQGTSMLAAFDHSLPIPNAPLSGDSKTPNSSKSVNYRWVLDFTDGGRSRGVVVTHTRMREIQQVLDPLATLGGDLQMPPFPGSWVGLLLDPTQPAAEHYVATYKSPTSAHPPLRLRLLAPNEVGLLLGKVPVRSLQEAWGVLEIVRDQCWINETLKTVTWIREEDEPADDESVGGATKEELEALLNGSLKPHSVPVNLYLSYHQPSMSGFEGDGTGLEDLDLAIPGIGNMGSLGDVPGFTSNASPPTASSIVMSIALPNSGANTATGSSSLDISSVGFGMGPSISSPHAQITVAHDPARRRGVSVRVDVNGAGHTGAIPMSMPFTYTPQQIEQLEEMVRRGGALGVPGRVWSSQIQS